MGHSERKACCCLIKPVSVCWFVRPSIGHWPGRQAAHSDVRTGPAGCLAPTRGSLGGKPWFPTTAGSLGTHSSAHGPGSPHASPAQPASPLDARGSRLAPLGLKRMPHVSSCTLNLRQLELAPLCCPLPPQPFHSGQTFLANPHGSFTRETISGVSCVCQASLGPRPWGQGQVPQNSLPPASVKAIICLLHR